MSSGFITETEIAEVRKKKQEEWEKVRNPDQPLERPEEPYDSRSLFERLKEQKMKKDLEYEEAHKLKNLIRGLDDDEVEFLDLVDRTKMKVEKQQQIEEKKELEEFRQKVASLQEESGNKIQLETITNSKSKPKLLSHTITRPSQKSILSGSIVVRKRKNGDLIQETATSETSMKKQKSDQDKTEENEEFQQEDKKEDENNSVIYDEEETVKNDDKSINSEKKSSETEKQQKIENSLDKGALKCIGILPGIGKYKESSDSEASSDSEEENDFPGSEFDLLGKIYEITRRKCVAQNEEE